MQEDVFKKSTWLHDKSVNECINQGNLLQYNKNCMQEIHSLSHPKWKKKKLEKIQLKSGTGQWFLLSSHLFNIILEGLAGKIRQQKTI